ncbi:MAG: YraN family protein [Solirubrobacteraceae bacterium]
MGTDVRHHLGAIGEQLAAEHLQRLGYRIVERNYRTRWGELDIVAFDGRTLAFCEVKTRRVGGRAGGPLEAVGPGKQAQVRRLAGRWLAERRDRPHSDALRFDAIGVSFDAAGRLVALEHLEGAF